MLFSEAVADTHRRVTQAYYHLNSSTSDSDKLARRNEFAAAVAACCVGEKHVLLPALQELLYNGAQRVEQYERDRVSIQEKLQRLNGTAPQDPSSDSELKALWVDLSAHFSDLDLRDLAALEECLSVDDSEALARRYLIVGSV
ncbi:hypothetical protein HIM_00669 [Hirsutella minnesotensis 3608]|nr:hypothetical protein HIM_00669 [Hirsutella minnesotensis 3608]